MGQPPVYNGTEAAHAAVLIFTGGIGDIHPNIGSFNIHVTGADTAAVEVAILEDVEDGVREQEDGIQAVGLGQRRPGPRERLH